MKLAATSLLLGVALCGGAAAQSPPTLALTTHGYRLTVATPAGWQWDSGPLARKLAAAESDRRF